MGAECQRSFHADTASNGLTPLLNGGSQISVRSERLDLAAPPEVVRMYLGGYMSIDHASGVAAPKVDPVFLHVRAGMTVIVDDGSDWRM